jgi:imidazolonepropionase
VTSELKILRLHKELAAEQPLDLVSTFLGAHVVPAEYRGTSAGVKRYIELLTETLIPEIATAKLAEFCDVFCDRGAFTRQQAKQLLEAGIRHGLTPRMHAEQLSRTGAAPLAVKLGPASCDHLEQINSSDIAVLTKSRTVATLLPGCDFHLGLNHYAPARKLIDAGAIVALATDYNPGTSPTMSMPMILSLACTQLRMTPAEAIAAATINAAYSSQGAITSGRSGLANSRTLPSSGDRLPRNSVFWVTLLDDSQAGCRSPYHQQDHNLIRVGSRSKDKILQLGEGRRSLWSRAFYLSSEFFSLFQLFP